MASMMNGRAVWLACGLPVKPISNRTLRLAIRPAKSMARQSSGCVPACMPTHRYHMVDAPRGENNRGTAVK